MRRADSDEFDKRSCYDQTRFLIMVMQSETLGPDIIGVCFFQVKAPASL